MLQRGLSPPRKLNQNQAVEQSVDWTKFRDDATALFDRLASQDIPTFN